MWGNTTGIRFILDPVEKCSHDAAIKPNINMMRDMMKIKSLNVLYVYLY